jgi:hypothetical protein
MTGLRNINVAQGEARSSPPSNDKMKKPQCPQRRISFSLKKGEPQQLLMLSQRPKTINPWVVSLAATGRKKKDLDKIFDQIEIL